MYHKIQNSWTKHLDFMLIDVICLELSFWLAYVIRQKDINISSNYIYANLVLVLVLVDICLLIFCSTLKNVLKRDYLLEFAATIKHVCLVALLAVLYLFSVKDAGDFSRMTFYLMAIFYLLVSYSVRLLWKRYIRKKIMRVQQKSVLIITDQKRLSYVARDIQNHSYDMMQISGIAVADLDTQTECSGCADDVCTDSFRKRVSGEADLCVGTSIGQVKIVADAGTLTKYICREWVDEVFLDLTPESPVLDTLVNRLMEMGVTIHIKLAERLELGNQRQFVEKLGKCTVLTASINTASGAQLLLKRLMDIVGGIIGCVCTGILFVFLAPAIYYQSPGPIFFSQTRIGKNGKKFRLYKFRSMYLDAEERKAELLKENRVSDGLMFKLDYDPRIIGCRKLSDGTIKKGLGNWMRDWSLDEFPQFWNVLKGDMSLVGTRPPTEDEWLKYELHHRSRLAIKPGITGMWQVSGRSNVTDFEQVVELDRRYITSWNPALDVKILWKTVSVVFRRDGAM